MSSQGLTGATAISLAGVFGLAGAAVIAVASLNAESEALYILRSAASAVPYFDVILVGPRLWRSLTDLNPCLVAVGLPWLALNISALVVGVMSGGYAYRLATGIPAPWRRVLVMPLAVLLGWLVWGLLALAFGYLFFGALELAPVCR